MVELDFIKVRDYSDATAYYKVKCSSKFTVYEFLTEYLLKRKEWGQVNINVLFLCPEELELLIYNNDKVGNVNCTLFEKVKNKIVKQIEATGGWGAMDYALHIEESGENEN